MKKSKKYLMALAICSLSVVAIGCSSNEKKNTANDTSETTDKKENKSSKSSNEEIVKKITEATKSIKSLKQKTEFKTSFDVNGSKRETAMIVDITTSDNPTITKLASTPINFKGKNSMMMYFTEDNFYGHDAITNEWANIKDEYGKKLMLSHKEASNIEWLIELINSVEKNLKVEEKNSEYKISFSGADDSIINYLKKVMVIFMNENSINQFLNDANVEKFEILYKVDKKTFMPKEYTVEIYTKSSKVKKERYFVVSVNGEFSDINKVSPIKIPDEVKNAEEYTGN